MTSLRFRTTHAALLGAATLLLGLTNAAAHQTPPETTPVAYHLSVGDGCDDHPFDTALSGQASSGQASVLLRPMSWIVVGNAPVAEAKFFLSLPEPDLEIDVHEGVFGSFLLMYRYEYQPGIHVPAVAPATAEIEVSLWAGEDRAMLLKRPVPSGYAVGPGYPWSSTQDFQSVSYTGDYPGDHDVGLHSADVQLEVTLRLVPKTVPAALDTPPVRVLFKLDESAAALHVWSLGPAIEPPAPAPEEPSPDPGSENATEPPADEGEESPGGNETGEGGDEGNSTSSSVATSGLKPLGAVGLLASAGAGLGLVLAGTLVAMRRRR